MSRTRKLSYLAGLVLAAVLVAVVAGYLVTAQRDAAGKLLAEYARGAEQAGNLSGSVLQGNLSGSQLFATQSLAGNSTQVRAALTANALGLTKRTIVIGADGKLVSFHPPTLTAAEVSATIAAVRPVREGSNSYSNLLTVGTSNLFVLTVPFGTSDGIRTWVFTISVAELSLYTMGYLPSANHVAGGGALVIDGNGRVIASSRGDKLAQPLADQALASALRGSDGGTVGSMSYATAPIPNTPWLMVFTAPTKALLLPVEESRGVAWRLFALFVVVLAGLLVVAAVTLDRSSRLAHARLHDALTGLPHRHLFVENTRLALLRRRQRGGEIAVLFIDLDHFKAVNDNYGHGVGDRLLIAVAARLKAAVRPDDVVSRFGGDEFLVLCVEVDTMDDAGATAARVQDALARPFEVDGYELTIGSSIGVVMSGQFTAADAAMMIQAADIAMYQAKRGAIVRYEVEMTDVKR